MVSSIAATLTIWYTNDSLAYTKSSTGSTDGDKLRHIAIAVRDPEACAKFFESAFGMTRAGNAMRGIYLTDGT